MSQVKQSDIITDLLIDFDEMGFAPTTACPDPEAYAKEWRQKITEALEKFCKQSEGEWVKIFLYARNYDTYYELTCPNCGEIFREVSEYEISKKYRYCSVCGAKMKGGEV